MVSSLITLSQLQVRANNWGIGAGTAVSIDLTNSVTKVSFISTNPVKTIPYPVSKSNAASKVATRLAIPLKMVEERFEITGSLSDTSGGDTAITVLKKLMAMFEGGGNTTFVWRSLTFSTASVLPVQITDVTFDDEWETIAATDSDKMDTNVTATASMVKIPFTIRLLLAKERGT